MQPEKWKVRSTDQQKIEWLLTNHLMWDGWPNGDDGIHDSRKRRIVTRMMEAGLLSQKTYWPDVALGSLIAQARKSRREGRVIPRVRG